jgi:mRNA-degrading endonuclease toxin of MazEF toxin-antitoxin module
MKDYTEWFTGKAELEKLEKVPVFHEREIWWCSLGVNIGDEEDGKNHQFERPVLVFKKFNRNIAWIIPMTTKVKDNKFHYVIEHEEMKFSLILSQLRLVSSKRLLRYMRKISPFRFREIGEKLKQLMFEDRA